MLFSVGCLYCRIQLTVNTQPCKMEKTAVFVQTKIPDGLKQSNHAFLNQIIGFSSDQIHGIGIFADKRLIFFENIVRDLCFSLPESFNQFLIRTSIILHSFLIPSSSSDAQSHTRELLQPPMHLRNQYLPSLEWKPPYHSFSLRAD